MRGTINLNDLSTKATLKLFDSLVKPVALYGAQIWADSTCLGKTFTNIRGLKDQMSNPDNDMVAQSVNSLLKKIASDSCERLHLCKLKWILGIHKKANNAGVWGDTGRTPLGTVCVYVRVYACTFACVRVCICVFRRVSVCICLCACICACVCECVYVSVCVCVLFYPYIP